MLENLSFHLHSTFRLSEIHFDTPHPQPLSDILERGVFYPTENFYIDGKALHYKVIGEGNPTVVIDIITGRRSNTENLYNHQD